jgi:hypothetical protein
MIIIDEDDPRFYIATSAIPNAGMGLFAKELIKKGSKLEITGFLVKAGSATDLCTAYANDYKFWASYDMNMKVVPTGFAAIANHSSDPKINNMDLWTDKNYSRKSVNAGQVYYIANRDIYPGEECVGNYGDDWNQKLHFVSAIQDNWSDFLQYRLYNLGELKLGSQSRP